MTKLTNLLNAYREKEDGAALAEYAVTFLVIVAVGTVGLATLGNNLSAAFGSIATWVQTNITTPFGG
jgi:Flp pilus assembly pilin Flp